MSQWFRPESQAELTMTFEDGREWHFPAVIVDEVSYWDEGYSHRRMELTFRPLEEWTISQPPPETKQQRRARLIREMYPAGPN